MSVFFPTLLAWLVFVRYIVLIMNIGKIIVDSFSPLREDTMFKLFPFYLIEIAPLLISKISKILLISGNSLIYFLLKKTKLGKEFMKAIVI